MKADKLNDPSPLKSVEQSRRRAKKRKNGDRLTNILLLLILAVGLGIMLYPTVSDWWNSFHQSRAVASYVAAVENMSNEEEEAMLAAAHAYNDRLAQTGIRFVMSDEELAEYYSLLDLTGTGIMGYIDIPAINVSLPVYHGTDEAVLQTAIGHLSGTSLPVGGQSSHCAVSGHRGLPSARLFTDLDDLKEGDIFTMTVLREKMTYMIDQIRIVLPEEVDDLAIEPGKDYCTLVTCTPYGINTHRMLVRGRRVDNLPDDVYVAPDATKFDSRLVIPAVAIPLLFVMLVVVLIVYRKKPTPKTKQQILDEFRKQ